MPQFVRTNAKSTDFQALIHLLDRDLETRIGKETQAFFAPFNFTDHIHHVIVAYHNDEAVGCGAFKHYDDQTAEIKRMFVKPQMRGQGIAGQIVAILETWAYEEGYEMCILETGKLLPEAIRAYEKAGYNIIPNYGQYVGIALSVCMGKRLP